MNSEWSAVSSGPDETHGFGRILGRKARRGDALFLCGELGAGKTCLAQGVAAGLDVPETTPVTSPSYTLLNLYTGRLELFHFDLYRLVTIEDLEDLGFDDCLYGSGVTLVEWLDRFPEFTPEGLYLTLSYGQGPDERRLLFKAHGTAASQWLERIREGWPGQDKNDEGI